MNYPITYKTGIIKFPLDDGKNYCCLYCDFHTKNRTHCVKHIKTKKHKNNDIKHKKITNNMDIHDINLYIDDLIKKFRIYCYNNFLIH